MGIYDRSVGKLAKPNWWVRYSVNGEEIREPGKGTRKATLAFEVELKRQIRRGTWVHPELRRGDAASFEVYARKVISRRVARGVKTADKDERGHVENHLIKMFPGLRVDELTFRAIKQAFAVLAESGKLSGRTVRNVHATLRSVLIEAAEDGLIDTAPSPLTARRDHLPPPIDRDSRWRQTARFERAEITTLLACAEVPTWRRVIYAACFLTGGRISELLGTTVGDYAALTPWPSLTLRASKVGRHAGDRMRHVPVFPELKTWLDWWLTEEWPILFGRLPKPRDPMFPTMSARRNQTGLTRCSTPEIFKQWQRYDLPAAQLTHRRIHDARRTFISALRTAGVPDKAIRALTHAGTGDRVLDAYTSWEWAGLCGELERVKWSIPRPKETRTAPVPLFARREQTP